MFPFTAIKSRTLRTTAAILTVLALSALGCAASRRAPSITPTPVVTSSASTDDLAAYDAAATYSEQNGGVSMIVWRGGEIVYERYADGTTADDAHNLYSGTKSFSCAIAVAAASDGLLTFDEPVANTITEWAGDPQKSQITIRQLLSLSSGIEGGPNGRVPTYTNALTFSMVSDPGDSFNYGPVPYQTFGMLMQRKLATTGESPLDFLTRKVFDPIGLSYHFWQKTADGEPHLPSGAFLTAREWLKYGELILHSGEWDGQQVLDASLLAECFQGSAINPAYGMTFWLPMAEGGSTSPRGTENGTSIDLSNSSTPLDVILAAGARGQRMYIVPSLEVIVLRQAEPPLGQDRFVDADFLQPIAALFAK